jgi:4a-hydroxytetrahydrobiopterin dehydratase
MPKRMPWHTGAMSAAVALDAESLAARLPTLPGWSLEQGRLCQAFRFASYGAAVGFAVQVALLAEKHDHHPDALTIGWKLVHVAYITHSAQGITELDLAAAAQVSALAGAQ